MIISGYIQNGVVVLEGGPGVPNGTRVTVVVPEVPVPVDKDRPRNRIVFPIIPSANPGSLNITAEQIAEILDEQDASS